MAAQSPAITVAAGDADSVHTYAAIANCWNSRQNTTAPIQRAR